MTKKDLVRLIREVVKREVKTQVNNVLTEMETTKADKTDKMSINEALDQTAKAFPTMKEFTSADARAGFAAMQTQMGNPANQPHTDLKGQPVDVSNLGGGLDKALTRDYSKLVQKFNK